MGIDSKSQGEGFRLRENGNLSLLNWGFRFFETHTLYDAGKQDRQRTGLEGHRQRSRAGRRRAIQVTVPRGRYAQLKPTMDVPKSLIAPIKKGQKIGKLRVSLDGKVIAEAPLVALNEVEEAGFFKRLWDELLMWWES